MSTTKTIEDLVSIVLVGNFNPAIFQPAWLAAKGLIRESEATAANIEIIHAEVAQFRAGWLHLVVTTNKFVASTSDPAHHLPLRDLVAGIFDLLDQTPTHRLGLNRSVHVDLGDDDAWHALGHMLAPKEPWMDILEQPGMRAVLMQGVRMDGGAGRTFFRVEPSQKYPHAAFIDVNNEIMPAQPERPNGNTAFFVGCINENWERVLKESSESIEKLVTRVRRQEKS